MELAPVSFHTSITSFIDQRAQHYTNTPTTTHHRTMKVFAGIIAGIVAVEGHSAPKAFVQKQLDNALFVARDLTRQFQTHHERLLREHGTSHGSFGGSYYDDESSYGDHYDDEGSYAGSYAGNHEDALGFHFDFSDLVDPDNLPGIIANMLPEQCTDADKQALCEVYQDVKSLVLSSTCRSNIGVDLPSDIVAALTTGIDCINVALCSQGSATTCLSRVAELLANPPDFDDDFKIELPDIDNPFELLPAMCGNGCYSTFTGIAREAYNFQINAPDCVAAFGSMDVEFVEDFDLEVPELPHQDGELEDYYDTEYFELDIAHFFEEAIDLLENGCMTNGNGHYCAIVLYDFFESHGSFDKNQTHHGDGHHLCVDDCMLEMAPQSCDDMLSLIHPGSCANDCPLDFLTPYHDELQCTFDLNTELGTGSDGLGRRVLQDSEGEFWCPLVADAEEECPTLEDFGCCASIFLSSPFFDIDASSATCLVNFASAQCGVEDIQRPCVDGLVNPVSIVACDTTIPESAAAVNEQAFLEAIANGAGVDPSAVIITQISNNADGTQTIAFEVILRGVRAEDSSAVSKKIASDEFANSIAAAAGVDAGSITTQTPVTETIQPANEESDKGVNIGLVASIAAAGCVVGGLAVGLTAVRMARNAQHATKQQEGVQNSDRGMPHSVKNPANMDI
jgi:hypothetical protein